MSDALKAVLLYLQMDLSRLQSDALGVCSSVLAGHRQEYPGASVCTGGQKVTFENYLKINRDRA